ncbi:hypothetical protein FMN50_05435, partial [Rhodobacterales bacterium]
MNKADNLRTGHFDRVARRKSGNETRYGFKRFGAALLTSTALVGIASGALAADKIVDGVQETITTAETFDNVTVGDTQPNSSLEVASGGTVEANEDLTVGKDAGAEGTVTISGAGSTLTAG